MVKAKLIVYLVSTLLLCCSCFGKESQKNGDDYITVSNSTTISEKENNTIISVVIYPKSALSDSYLITLSSEGILTTFWGARESFDVYSDFEITNISKSESIKLKQTEFEELLELINKLSNSDIMERDDGWDDVWYTDIIFNGIVYHYVNVDIKHNPRSAHVDDIIRRFIEYSPIIVDMYGFS